MRPLENTISNQSTGMLRISVPANIRRFDLDQVVMKWRAQLPWAEERDVTNLDLKSNIQVL
jgi:hypothetical protein